MRRTDRAMVGPRLQVPRLLLFFAVAAIVFSASFVWLAWQLVASDRLIEEQRAQERTQAVGAAVAGDLVRQLAAAEADLRDIAESESGQIPPSIARRLSDDSVLLLVDAAGVRAYPPGRLLYLPRAAWVDAEPPAFDEAERLELGLRDFGAAIARLHPLASSTDPAIRAGALLRLARNLRKSGRREEALRTYTRLAEMPGIAIGERPADVLGRYGRCSLMEEMRSPDLQGEATRFLADLDAGTWNLDESAWRFYRAECAHWLGSASVPPVPRLKIALAQAAAILDQERQRSEGGGERSGRRDLRADGFTFLLAWHAADRRFVGLVAGRRLFAPSPPVEATAFRASLVERAALRDAARPPSGRPLEGRAALEVPPLPWSLALRALPDAGDDASVFRTRILSLTGVVVAFLFATTMYFVSRAISREMKLARLQSDFVGAVSHEFRTPLSSIRQMSEMLADGRVATEQRRAEYHQQLRWEAERLQKLVENLLDFQRLEGRLRRPMDVVDPAEHVRNVVAEFQRETNGARIELRIADALPRIRADREMLDRAIRNLLDNAVKYAPDESPIEVAVSRVGDQVRISVRDEGMGIAPHEIESIFDKFTRAESARIAGIRGSGLGLAMVRDVAEAHHGSVLVESAPGLGSTFTIVLPVGRTS